MDHRCLDQAEMTKRGAPREEEAAGSVSGLGALNCGWRPTPSGHSLPAQNFTTKS